MNFLVSGSEKKKQKLWRILRSDSLYVIKIFQTYLPSSLSEAKTFKNIGKMHDIGNNII